jgi:hypothetical protein
MMMVVVMVMMMMMMKVNQPCDAVLQFYMLLAKLVKKFSGFLSTERSVVFTNVCQGPYLEDA